MNQLNDLNLKDEILPFFDYTQNHFAKSTILNFLQKPLKSVEKINERQEILKAFIANAKVLKSYSYTPLYLNETHRFLTNVKDDSSGSGNFFQLFLNRKIQREELSGKLTLLILLFHRLHNNYLSRIDIDSFPVDYQKSIRRIRTFLETFESNKYEHIIREERLTKKHISALYETITKLRREKSINRFWEDLFEFEAYLSISRGIIENQFTFPVVFENPALTLEDFYHPLLSNPVKNNLDLRSNVILLNGPNMSGKSTLLKAVGLCTYLAHVGLAIPASAAEIPFYNDFSFGINKTDDLRNGYSHFMSEVMNLKSVVESAISGRKVFAVFDELFSGTNAEDALEICKTTIAGLSKFQNCTFFISTHLQELKNCGFANVSTCHIGCELVEGKPMFNYKLESGWSDVKVGRILFDQSGLNDLLG